MGKIHLLDSFHLPNLFPLLGNSRDESKSTVGAGVGVIPSPAPHNPTTAPPTVMAEEAKGPVHPPAPWGGKSSCLAPALPCQSRGFGDGPPHSARMDLQTTALSSLTARGSSHSCALQLQGKHSDGCTSAPAAT